MTTPDGRTMESREVLEVSEKTQYPYPHRVLDLDKPKVATGPPPECAESGYAKSQMPGNEIIEKEFDD